VKPNPIRCRVVSFTLALSSRSILLPLFGSKGLHSLHICEGNGSGRLTRFLSTESSTILSPLLQSPVPKRLSSLRQSVSCAKATRVSHQRSWLRYMIASQDGTFRMLCPVYNFIPGSSKTGLCAGCNRPLILHDTRGMLWLGRSILAGAYVVSRMVFCHGSKVQIGMNLVTLWVEWIDVVGLPGGNLSH